MTIRFHTLAFLILPLLALAGCSGGGGDDPVLPPVQDISAPQSPAPQEPTSQAPVAPAGVAAQASTGQAQAVTLSWEAVADATSYNLYWGSSAGLDKASATKLESVTSPTPLPVCRAARPAGLP